MIGLLKSDESIVVTFPSEKFLKIASHILIRDGLNMRIRGAGGCSKLLCRFETEQGLEHRLSNARMLLGNWLELMSKGPEFIVEHQIESHK